MAKFSESFLQQLGRPGWSEGMFGLGQAIGGAQGQVRDQQKKQEFNQLMQQGQQAMASKDPAALANVAQQLGAAGYQKEAQQLAQASRAATEQQRLQQVGKGALSSTFGQDPAAMMQSAQQLNAMGRTEEAMKLAQTAQAAQTGLAEKRKTTNIEKGEQVLTRFATARGMKMSTPEARQGFYGIARSYGVPVDRATEIYRTFTQASGDRTTKGEVTIRDEKGNLFTRATQYNKQGVPREIIVPFPGSPEKPQGRLTIVSGTTGGGAFDRPELAGKTTVEQEFNKERVAAVTKLPSMQRSATNIREAIDLLESGDVKTGGFTRKVSRGLSDFLGTTPKDIGEFETRLGDVVLARLESFTGAISEGERNFLIEQIGSYQASGESNLGRLKVILEQAEGLLQDGIALGSAENFESYRRGMLDPDLSFIPENERQEAKQALQRGDLTLQELRGMY
mgnify:CR=1 FL=1|tara:strand:+ start:16 stop:1368 length:1353 start_codon:yes stop_codon:yes gene_type:complete